MDLSNLQIPRIKISVRVIAVAMAIVGLVFFWWAMGTKIPEIDAQTAQKVSENTTLSNTEKNLAELYTNMAFYLDETDRLYKETEDILTEFPTFMYLEDKILYADTLLKTDLSGFNLSQFSYGQSSYLMNVTYGVDGQTMELYSVNLSGRYTDLTYPQVKELIDYGLNSPQRFVLNSITMAYNERSGYLSGDFSFSTYFIPGQATPYEFPESVIYDLGTSNRVNNLFGARQTPANTASDGTVGQFTIQRRH